LPLPWYVTATESFFLFATALSQCLIADVGLYTFQEAFDKTGRIINITVAPNNNYDPPRLLNYLTAPHVCVWSAAAASCALPGNRAHSSTHLCPCQQSCRGSL
jgi:predicted acylesterase/phospholipase RssA